MKTIDLLCRPTASALFADVNLFLNMHGGSLTATKTTVTKVTALHSGLRVLVARGRNESVPQGGPAAETKGSPGFRYMCRTVGVTLLDGAGCSTNPCAYVLALMGRTISSSSLHSSEACVDLAVHCMVPHAGTNRPCSNFGATKLLL